MPREGEGKSNFTEKKGFSGPRASSFSPWGKIAYRGEKKTSSDGRTEKKEGMTISPRKNGVFVLLARSRRILPGKGAVSGEGKIREVPLNEVLSRYTGARRKRKQATQGKRKRGIVF